MPEYKKDGKVIIFENSIIIDEDNIEFGDYVIIDSFVFIHAKKKIKIGNFVHISVGVSLAGGEEIIINDFVGFSAGVRVFSSSDDFQDFGFGNPTIDEKYRNIKMGRVEIGKFAIIGANSVILPGVKIGEGASVSACSVVSRDLKPWGIYVGNRLIGFRNKDKVLENYEKFMQDSYEKRLGRLFKKT